MLSNSVIEEVEESKQYSATNASFAGGRDNQLDQQAHDSFKSDPEFYSDQESSLTESKNHRSHQLAQLKNDNSAKIHKN